MMKRTRETGLTNELEAIRQGLDLDQNVRNNGAIGDGARDESGVFLETHNRLVALGGGRFKVPPGVYQISESITIGAITAGAEIQLIVQSGADISIDAGVTLTIAGESEILGRIIGAGTVSMRVPVSPSSEVFATTLTVAFTDSKVIDVAWFAGADMGAQISNAISAVPATGGILDASSFTGAQAISVTVALPTLTTLWLGEVTITSAVTPAITYVDDCVLVGEGRNITIIIGAVAGPLLRSAITSTRHERIKILDLQISNTSRDTAGGIGIDFTNISRSTIRDCNIVDVELGISVDATGGGAFYNVIENCHITTVDTGISFTTLANENRVMWCRIGTCEIGIDIDDTSNVLIFHTPIEAFTNIGIRVGFVTATTFTKIMGCRLENSAAAGIGIWSHSRATALSVIDSYHVNNEVNILHEVIVESSAGTTVTGANPNFTIVDGSAWDLSSVTTSMVVVVAGKGYGNIATINDGTDTITTTEWTGTDPVSTDVFRITDPLNSDSNISQDNVHSPRALFERILIGDTRENVTNNRAMIRSSRINDIIDIRNPTNTFYADLRLEHLFIATLGVDQIAAQIYGTTGGLINLRNNVDSGYADMIARDVESTRNVIANSSPTNEVRASRIAARDATVVVTGDFSLSAGWGTTATVSSVVTRSRDQRGTLTVSSSGTGQAANPTIVFTFTDGAWTTAAPFATIMREGGDQVTVGVRVTAITTTSLTMTFDGTPVDTETYVITWMILG